MFNPDCIVSRPLTLKQVHATRTLRGWPVFTEALKIAVESITAHKLRSFLTLIGIIIGVASVMIVGAFINGMESYVTDNVTSILGSNSFIVSKVARMNMSHEEWERLNRIHKDLTPDDFDTVRQQSTYAKTVAAEKTARTDVIYKNREVLETRITGCTANLIDMTNVEVEVGRFFQSFEVERARPVCVIGWGIRNELFPSEDPLGKEIKLNGQNYQTIGVLTKRGSFLGNNMDNEVYVPISSFSKTFNYRRGWTLRIKTGPDPDFHLGQDEVRSILRGKHHLRPSEEDDFDILSTDEINQSVEQLGGAVKMVVTPITTISLLVGGIVIMNIMLVSVTERTREIGIRKAIGARRRDLLLQFLLESAILGLIGGLAGVLFSYLICFILKSALDYSVAITGIYILMSVSISGVIGIISGMYPAFKAARLDPIRALSFEN